MKTEGGKTDPESVFLKQVENFQKSATENSEPEQKKPENWERYRIYTPLLVSEENARAQVLLLLERNRVDLSQLDEVTREYVLIQIENVERFVREGMLEIYEEGQLIKVKQNLKYTSEKGTVKELVYGEVTGRAHLAAQMAHASQRSLTLMMNICESEASESIINQLRSGDLDCLRGLAALFL